MQRLAGFAASTAATCALIFGVFLQPAVTQSLGILPDAWMQDRYYRYYGVITSFLTNLTNLEIDKPEDYSEEAINAILDDVEAGEKYTTSPAWPDSYAAQTPADEQVKQPTILYVMDESYWDVSELEQYGFQCSGQPPPTSHRPTGVPTLCSPAAPAARDGPAPTDSRRQWLSSGGAFVTWRPMKSRPRRAIPVSHSPAAGSGSKP